MKAVLEVLYAPLDLVLGWTAYLPPTWAVAVVGAVSGAGVMLLQKYASRQALLARCKEDLRLLKARLREARRAGDAEAAARAGALVRRISGKYLWGALKPALWSVPIIGVVALWCGARLGWEPVRPGETLEVVAHFEDRARGFAHVVPAEGMRPEGAAVAPVGMPRAGQASWKVRAEGEGRLPLVVRYADRSYEVELPVSARGGRPPEPIFVFHESTPHQDQLQAIELRLRSSMGPAWWNLGLGWVGLYFAVALLVAIPLRFALRVQ
ncbi:MAG: hypothetical protein ACK44W_00915 [Planctomycetota bacterium]